MSYTMDRKRHYEDITTSSQPIQHDTQATAVVSQPPPHSHEQQQPHVPQEMELNGKGTPSQPMKPTTNEAERQRLMEELNKLHLRAVQLDSRASTAETGYMELKHLKEVEAKSNLDNYKILAEKRFKASQEEIRTLQELTQHQEQHIALLSSRMERARAELFELKTTPRKGFQNGNMQKQHERYKTRYEEETDNVRRLQIHLRSLEVESDELQRRRHETPQQVEAISTLERRMDLYELLSGMKIASHKTNGTREIYSILQAGRNGRISFKLTFYQNDNGQPTARYSPLLRESDDHLLPAHMKEPLEFPQNEVSVLLWRTTTLLNKKSDDNN